MILKIKQLSADAAMSILDVLLAELRSRKAEIERWKEREREGRPSLSSLGWRALREPYEALRKEYGRLNSFMRKEHPAKYERWMRGRKARKEQ